jgi:amino acid transporter
MGAAALASALFYTRKLYKDTLNRECSEAPEHTTQIAAFVYYLARPAFGVFFAMLVVVSSAAFIHATTVNDTLLSVGFVLFCALLSAYGAAITGRVVRHIELVAGDRLRTFGTDA